MKPGSSSDFPCAFWDFFPTFSEILGEPAPRGLDGVSLIPTLTGKGAQAQREYLYWELYNWNAARGFMRDAKICQIYEGTQEIQRLVIAREMVKRATAAPAGVT